MGFGANTEGQLGIGNIEDQVGPVEITGVDMPFLDVEAGDTHSLAISSDGRLYATGSNACGELGLGDTGGKMQFTKLLDM